MRKKKKKKKVNLLLDLENGKERTVSLDIKLFSKLGSSYVTDENKKVYLADIDYPSNDGRHI